VIGWETPTIFHLREGGRGRGRGRKRKRKKRRTRGGGSRERREGGEEGQEQKRLNSESLITEERMHLFANLCRPGSFAAPLPTHQFPLTTEDHSCQMRSPVPHVGNKHTQESWKYLSDSRTGWIDDRICYTT